MKKQKREHGMIYMQFGLTLERQKQLAKQARKMGMNASAMLRELIRLRAITDAESDR